MYQDSDTRFRTATENQTRYVKAEVSGVGSYMIAMGHMVEGQLDPQRLEQAANALVERHDALRSSFSIETGAVAVLVSQKPKYQFHSIDLADRTLETFRRHAVPLIFEHVDPFTPGSLMRFVVADYGDCWRFTIAAHHAITDGFSRGVMNRELLKLYVGEELPSVESYYDYALNSEKPHGLKADVQGLIDALPIPVRLVGDGFSDGVQDDAGQVAIRNFEGLGRSLKTVARQTGATRFGILAATYALAVQGFLGDRRVSSFFQSEGRKSLGASNSIVGPFSNTLPLDLTVDPEKSFATFARDVAESTNRAVALETEQLLEAVLADGKAPGISINMFPPASRIRAGKLEIGPREFLDRRTEFDLNLVWAEDRNVLKAHAYFNRSILSERRIGSFLDLLGRILDAVLEDPNRDCRNIIQVARKGHEVILKQTSLEPDPECRLHQPFFELAEKQPEATAVLTSQKRISYAALAQSSQAVAAALQQAGVTSKDRVAIFAQRDPSLISAMLGVSACGASFALIDATYPVERIKFMLECLGAHFLLPAGQQLPSELVGRIKCIQPDFNATVRCEIVNGPPRRHCCHLFTSGTTGLPKLITHPDKTLLRFIDWQAKKLDLSDRITTMMMAGVAHDPTLRDVFLPLSHGGTVVVPTPEELLHPQELRNLFSRSKCNVVRFSPSTARLLTAGGASETEFEHLRGIFWGGERLPRSSVQSWRTLAPDARQFHVFGTTETPQAFLIHEIDEPPEPTQREIPLGQTLPWTGVSLRDEDGSAVALGEVGEIVAELADPVGGINSKLSLPGSVSACQHFTGDLGYQLSDGNIYFAGRRDGQVKVNGFRVELGEIEAKVEAITGIERAYATLFDDRIFLFAHAVSETLKDTDIKAALSRSLPSYMMPARIFLVDRFPTTRNGKVDREAFIALVQKTERDEIDRQDEGRVLTDAEKLVSTVFAKATGRSKIDPGVSLFDLGADSLSAIEARLELEAQRFILPENWEWMAVSELALHRAEPDVVGKRTSWFLHTRRLETFIVLRSLAIILIVAHHTGWELGVGASIVLLTLSGFTFGRLHLLAIVDDGRTGRVWSLIAKLLVPLVPASILIFTAHSALGNSPHLATIFLYENVSVFIDSVILGVRSSDHHVIWLWFLHAYIQIFFILGVLLGIPKLRSVVAVNPWRSALIFFGITEAIGVGLILVLSGLLGVGDIGHVSALLHHAPTSLLPLFALGVMFALSDTTQRRVVSMGIGVAHLALAQHFYHLNNEVTWLLALSLCAFFPFVTLPRVLTGILVIISGHALMIYLSHRMVHFGLETLVPNVFPVPLEIAVQLLVGALLGMALRPVLDRLGINRLAYKRISFSLRPGAPH